ncbi:MAG: WXG100 family type VII secretion target [Bacilli bacterium]|nr:WXG100 family type VII secretion target [Bacilli bacterium]
MAQNVHVDADPQELINCGNKIIENASDYNNEVNKIFTTVTNLKGVWTGERATSFTDAIEKFKADYENFGKLINQLGELVLAIGKDYDNFENGRY